MLVWEHSVRKGKQMTDENQTETPNVPTFEPIEGATRQIALIPINEANGMVQNREATFTFGKYTGKANSEGKVPAPKGRWQVEITRIVDGVPDVVDGRAPDPKKALANCLKSLSSSVGIDDYDLSFFDEDPEFFGQKLTAPPKPAYDPATIVEIGGEDMSLSDVRGAVETDLTTIKDKGVEGQKALIHAADALKTVWVALDRDIKAVKKWAADGSNVPQVAALGKGTNAIQEFIDIARLRDSEREVLPVSTQSGKGVNQHRSSAQNVILNGANGDDSGPIQRFAADRDHDPAQVFEGDMWLGNGDDAKRFLSPQGVGAFLRTMSADPKLCDLTSADEYNLDELCDAVDKKVADRAAGFIAGAGVTTRCMTRLRPLPCVASTVSCRWLVAPSRTTTT